jgi:hypothetical protein
MNGNFWKISRCLPSSIHKCVFIMDISPGIDFSIPPEENPEPAMEY